MKSRLCWRFASDLYGWEVSTTGIMDTSLRARRRHRSWSDALKREIVAASLAPGASVSVVARQYDVNANLVFSWRKRFGDAPNAPPAAQLVPVLVTPDRVDAAPPSPAVCASGWRLGGPTCGAA